MNNGIKIADRELSCALNDWNKQSVESRNELLKFMSLCVEEQNYPIYESESKVILLYSGQAEKVWLNSDITGWTKPIAFVKLDETDYFFLALELEPDARIEYHLIVDDSAVCDPLNKYKSLNGLGELSELAMPCYVRHPYFDEYLYGKAGDFTGLIKHIISAGALPYEHEVFVYLPAGYNDNIKYPVLYFHDGPDYIRFGLAPYSVDRLIKEEKIERCIAVFVTPPNLHQQAIPNRSTEYGMNDHYVSFFCDELVSFIDNNYPTNRSPQHRLVTGDSYAGLISLYIAFKRPDLFGKVYSQSGYFSFNNDSMIRLVKEYERKTIHIFMDIGTYEKKVGADFLPQNELDFTSANRRMKELLLNKEYDFNYKEYSEGHTWGNWRRHLIDSLTYFFPLRKS